MQIYAAVHGDITSSKPPAHLVGTGTIPIEDVDGKMVNICVEGEHFHCPACNTTGVLISHGQGWPDNGKRIILHGDVAACACNPKPRVIATKQRLVSVTVEDLVSGSEVIEHWYTLEDDVGNPVEGYCYDLYCGQERVVHKGHFSLGKTTSIPGGSSSYVIWLDRDSAKRDVISE
jgi:uncharacterized Zn-binding protein involved in type VI secretion